MYVILVYYDVLYLLFDKFYINYFFKEMLDFFLI